MIKTYKLEYRPNGSLLCDDCRVEVSKTDGHIGIGLTLCDDCYAKFSRLLEEDDLQRSRCEYLEGEYLSVSGSNEQEGPWEN